MSTETIVKACAECGAEVSREVGTDRFSKLFADGPWHCEKCAAEQRSRWDEEDRQRLERAKAMERERRLQTSGLPESRRVEFDSLGCDSRVLTLAQDWAAGEIRGLVLVGPVGTGKTQVAGAAAFAMLRRRMVRWAPVPSLFTQLDSGFESSGRQWALDTLGGGDALVLDDLDKSRGTSYGAERMFAAIDYRIEHRVPLLVTANLSLDGLAAHWSEQFGDAIASRLIGYCEIARVDGHDRRLAA